MGLLLLVLVLLLCVGGLPNFGYHSYGYAPSGAGILVFIVLLWFLMAGR